MSSLTYNTSSSKVGHYCSNVRFLIPATNSLLSLISKVVWWEPHRKSWFTVMLRSTLIPLVLNGELVEGFNSSIYTVSFVFLTYRRFQVKFCQFFSTEQRQGLSQHKFYSCLYAVHLGRYSPNKHYTFLNISKILRSAFFECHPF